MDIIKPTLLLNKDRAMRNIERMARKAKKSGVRFRPHFKTHQSAEIGEWFRQFGVSAITVSSVDMAAYFAQHGWNDITIAFPVNILEIEGIKSLADTISLGLLVEAVESVEFLRKHLSSPVKLWIKIDSGYHRTGLLPDDIETIVTLAHAIEQSENLYLAGLLTHSGQTYKGRSQETVREIYQDVIAGMKRVQGALHTGGFSHIEISIGDTPSCSIVEDLSDADEIRPGNFVFYDVMQWKIGSCMEDDLAVAVACPVVAKHAARQEIVIYGGAVHLSKEFITTSVAHNEEKPVFGYIALLEESGWGSALKHVYVSRLSQEHGIIKATTSLCERIKPGDLVVVLPIHSCLAANLLKIYSVSDGTILG